jgi:hypothetical protein
LGPGVKVTKLFFFVTHALYLECYDFGKPGAYHNGVLLKDTPLVSNIRLGRKALPEINTILIADSMSDKEKKCLTLMPYVIAIKLFLSLILPAKLFVIGKPFQARSLP